LDEAPELELRHVAFDTVEFAATLPDGSHRLVSVVVGSGPTWAKAVRFPNIASEGGESLGDDGADEQVRRRASEELVRLAAAIGATERRAAA
jgi:hypothetical protein